MMWFSQRPSISVNDMRLYVKLAHQTVHLSFRSRYLIALLLPLRLQVSLLEYRKRKQSSGRDSEPTGSSSSLGSNPTRVSHYSQDSHHPHSHQQMQPLASSHSSFSSSAHTNPVPQIEEVSPPDQQGLQSRCQDNNNQWWEAKCDGSLILRCFSTCYITWKISSCLILLIICSWSELTGR